MSNDYRNALRNIHNLVDELEDISMENEALNQENKMLEQDVQIMAEVHNRNVNVIRDLAADSKEFKTRRVSRCSDCGCNCNQCKEVKCAQCENFAVKEEEKFDFNGFMSNMCKKATMFKWKSIFVVTLLLVILLAIGASPSNIVSWEAFVDLYIEYICNPATMAMSMALVILLYKGLVKRNKK